MDMTAFNERLKRRKRRTRRRRWMKRLVVCAVLAMMVAVSSWNIRASPAPPGRWDNPTREELDTARKAYSVAGGPCGEAGVYYERWIKYADYISGKVDDPAKCEEAANENYSD